jgi:deoxyribose-phosphate aldolase
MSELTSTGRHQQAARALACLDLTSLNLDDTPQRIDALCDRALLPAPGIDMHPAAVCIYPRFVSQARARVHDAGIAVAAVANFPLGTASADAVVEEVEQALADGADEIDVVFPFRAYLAGDRESAAELVRRVSAVCHQQHSALLKVILETGVLHEASTIKDAARIAVANGADFLKTSTGKLEPAATPESAQALLEVIVATRGERQNVAAGGDRQIGLKVAGGVKTVAEAAAYLDLADRYLQPDHAVPSNFRFGASGLLNDIVAVLGSSQETQMSADY